MLQHQDLTAHIIGLAIEVHRDTGPGLMESITKTSCATNWKKPASPSKEKS